MTLHSLFYPRGVAVVGSTSEGKLGYQLINQLLAGGFQPVYAVNPKGQGLPAPGTGAGSVGAAVPGYTAVSRIDGPVDLAVIVSPPATVTAVLEDCAAAGVGAAVIITSGFSEAGNHAAEEEVARVARRLGIRFVGPNCAGILNTRHRLAPTLETLPPTGGVSFIAQSGAVGGVLLAWAKEFGLGIGKFVSYGNGADLREIELLHYLAEDPDTEVVALYIESTVDGRAFMDAARACTRRKPLVVIKSGRSASGQRATLSHTGSMAGADAVYDAALRQCGAIRVDTIEELFDTCKAFVALPPLQGNRVVIVSNSGGPAVMAADWAEGLGLNVQEPSAPVKAWLAEFLPPHCAFKNPIDLTVEGTEEGYRRALLALLEEYDAALALNIAPAYLDSLPLARGVCDAAAQSGKPVVASFLPARIVQEAVPYLEERGVPNFATGERALTALHNVARCSTCPHPNPPPLRPQPYRAGQVRLAGEGEEGNGAPSCLLPGDGPLLEHEALAWLRENGLPVPPYRFARSPVEAVAGCREIGYPVVMKVVSPDILHKSDAGGVILGVQDDAGAADAFARLERAAAGKDFRGVVIYPFLRGGHEVLLGIFRDSQFGPVVAFGAGGIYTEIWHDVVLRVAPVSPEEAWEMIHAIRFLPVLQGARGGEPCDLHMLAEVLSALSQLPFRYPEIAEIDLNPVFVFPDRVMIADVRVIRLPRSHKGHEGHKEVSSERKSEE